jgi:hypothetical protein
MDFSSGRYSASAGLGYDGGRWKLDSILRHGYSEGVNRYFAAPVAERVTGFGINAGFEISPRTTLQAAWASSRSDRDTQGGDTESHELSATALWEYSSLLSLGPGIRISRQTGQMQGDRDAFGPQIAATYRLSSKISVNGRLGFDFVEYDGAAADSFLSASIGANYRMNALWGFNLSLVRDAQADGMAGAAFRETTAFRIGVNRNIRRVQAGLGIGYERSSSVAAAGAAAPQDSDFLICDLSLRFPVSGERLTGTVFARVQRSASDDISRDWSGYQTGVTLNYNF